MKDFLTLVSEAETVIVGAGSGLSSAAGYTYSGARFDRYFSDFAARYGFEDMYSGGFYPFETPEEQWAYWSRYIWINRYAPIPKPVYTDLLSLLKDRDLFVITTNVDHCFQRAGFDKDRLFYTQGDYGLWQCSEPCHAGTYDNLETVREMVLAQGYSIADDGTLIPPETPKMRVPSELVPRCPRCGRPMSMNLRADDTFVQDAGWDAAAERYTRFLRTHRETKTLFLELGVGYNTPGIIKYPFWQYTYSWPDAGYVCINQGQTAVPKEIQGKSLCIGGDIGKIIQQCLRVSQPSIF